MCNVNKEITGDIISEYSELNGAIQVWKTWKDQMLEHGRSVKPALMEWPIPQQDIKLDAAIAFSVIDDFLEWFRSHK